MKSIKIIRKITALTAMLVGVTGRAGDSAPFLLDTTDPLITAPITYNSAWVGGDSSAEVVITDNGTEIKRTTGKGEFVWAPITPGKHTLTYATYIDGVQQEEVYTVTVFKDWKYTIEDGKATIVETTETIRNSDSLVIPHEIDGHMVTSIDIKILNDVRYSRDIVIPSAFLESIDINDADWEASLRSGTVDRYDQAHISYERGLKSLSYGNLYYWNSRQFRELGISINGPCLVFFDVGFHAGYDSDHISVYINGKSYMPIKYDEPRGKFWLSKGSNSIIFVPHGGKAWVNLPEKRFGGRYTLSALFPSLYSEVRNLVLSGESLHVSQYSFLGCEKLESISIPQGCTIKEWCSEGSSGWRFGTNGVLRSGKIGCNASSEMNMTVAKSGRLKYKWKASSEYYKDDSIGVSDVFDYGYLEVDGKALGLLTDYKLEGVSIGGNTKWQDVEVDLTGEGPHTIRWIYAKDEYDDPMMIGEDCIWVDDIRFMPLTTVEFDIGSAIGAPPSTITEICDTKINLPIYFGFQKPKYTLTGWSDGNNTYSPGGEFELRATNVTLVAVYDANTIGAPKIESSDVVDGGILDAASATIKMSCDKESTIYYTLDGSIPTATSAKYTGEFEAFGLGEVTIKAIALKDDYFDSDVTTFKYTRRPFTLSESVNVNGVSVMSTSASPWFRVLGEESYDGSEAIRSGAIGPNELSSIEMIVENEGMISFWWKVSSHEDPRGRKFDYMAFFVDDVEIAWISGEKDWVNVTYQIANAGTHTLKWVYMKNGDAYVSGEDCAWLDKMMWMGGTRFDITYENLKGATHQNPSSYYEGMIIKFTEPSAVNGYTFSGWTPSEIIASDTGNKIVTANWEWTPQDALVDASITGGKPITVKADWVKTELEKKFGVGKKDEFIAKFGDNFTSAMSKKTGKRDGVGNELLVWHDYVAGTDPTDVKSTFKAKIEMQNGKPIISWEPNLNSLGEERVYTVYGKESLSDIWHSPIAALDHFFKVDVMMPYDVTVILNMMEGSTVDPLTIRAGQPLGELPTPTRVGYTFLGWFTAQEGGEAVAQETIVTADMTLYAKWTIKSYTVVFDANGGSGGVSTSYNHGATLGEMPVPTRDGYTFTGWFTAASGGTQVAASTVVTGPNTLYAQWEEITSLTLSGALDIEGLGVTVGGNVEWFGQTDISHDAVDAAQSGYISDDQTSWMQVVVKDVSSVSFWWKVSSEEDYDELHFYVDGTEVVDPISGQRDWIKVEYALTAGSHTLKWEYTKDGSVSDGDDCGWVDSVVLTSSQPQVLADLVHRWSFNGDLTDSAGGQTATAVGNVTASSTQYTLSGGVRGSSYINLGANVLPNDGSPVTLEMWVTQWSYQYYARIWDFGNTGEDDMYMGLFATYSDCDSIVFRNSGVVEEAELLAPYTKGTEFYIAVVMTPLSTGRWKLDFYKKNSNGVTLKSYSATTTVSGWTLQGRTQAQCYLGHAISDANDANASYNEFRIWKKAMTEAELTASAIAGPDANLWGNANPGAGSENADTREKVQLWEDGPYWATTNIGAEKPEDYGYYFWWGDTIGYKRENNKWVASDGSNLDFWFDWDTCPTCDKDNSTLQSEGWITAEGVLAPEHDAAKKHWGGDWRMPTKQEFDDLISKCDWTWTTLNGVNGYIVRGKGDYTSNSIFLPCSGYGRWTSLDDAGSSGYYWSSVPLSDSGYSWTLDFLSWDYDTYYNDRGYVRSVRPLQGFTK